MITLAAVVLLFLLAPAQPAWADGDAQAGKALWESFNAMGCRFCHGAQGEGAFGPILAGRGLPLGHFVGSVRQPLGVMPGYVDSQFSDTDLANLRAYLNGLPHVAQPGKPRFEMPPDAPRGQQFAIGAIGCSQCHGPILSRMRQTLGALDADFATFRDIVYNHTTVMPKIWQDLGEHGHPLMMGNYSPDRLPETMLQDIYAFARDLGFRPLLEGSLSAGVAGKEGVTYTLDVQNFGLRDKGLAAEGVTIAVAIPAGAKVVSAQGTGYQGVRADAELKADAAVWQLPRIGPTDRQSFTITLSKAGTASDNVRGVMRWTKPAVKAAGPMDSAPIQAAPIASH